MDDLRAKGHTFEGDKPKEEPKEPEKKPEEAPEEPKEPEKPIEEPEKPLETGRKPREPKQIPAWKANIEEKNLGKGYEAKSEQEKQELRTAIEELKSEINNLKGTKTEKSEEIDDWIEKMVQEKGVEADVDFLKSFANELLKRVPKQDKTGIPEDLPKALEAIAEIKSKSEKEKEDYEYDSNFRKEIIPKLKEEYPQITDEEIESVKSEMKKPYFSERFISLSAGEIYQLTKSTFKDLIAPERRQTVEKGTKGISRGGKMLDYGNLTEEDYKNMTPQEREEANKFLLNK
jgi:hypothetical protein